MLLGISFHMCISLDNFGNDVFNSFVVFDTHFHYLKVFGIHQQNVKTTWYHYFELFRKSKQNMNIKKYARAAE